jgi:hypothetical protein
MPPGPPLKKTLACQKGACALGRRRLWCGRDRATDEAGGPGPEKLDVRRLIAGIRSAHPMAVVCAHGGGVMMGHA